MIFKKDDGISVKEIEEYAKRNKFPVALALGVFLACLFSIFLSMTKLAIVVLVIGAFLGIFFPARIALIMKKLYSFIGKQEKTTQLIIGVVFLVLSIFFPPAVFFLVGLHGGKDMRHLMMENAHPME